MRFRRFSLLTLAFTLVVILWGAYVRASGSGAGCGSHWPTCHGQVIPRAPSQATVIEFAHRATSGIAFFMVLAQLVWARRIFPRGHGARRAAAVAMVLMITEALIGAGLVKFEMVADNPAVGRGAWVATHLVNTFALVASIVLAGFLAAPRGPAVPATAPVRVGLILGLGGTLLVAASGAIAALGDTLFPVTSFAEGFRQDLSPAAHLFVRLRLWHPVLAAVVAFGLLAVTAAIVLSDRARTAALTTAILVLVQVAAGLLNLALLAPIPMQILHLLLADLVWIALVRLAAGLRYGLPQPSAAFTMARASSMTLVR